MTLLSKLRTISEKVDVVPPGWRTAAQWASKWQMRRAQAAKLLNDGINASPPLVRMEKFRVKGPTGKVYPTPHYGEIEKVGRG